MSDFRSYDQKQVGGVYFYEGNLLSIGDDDVNNLIGLYNRIIVNLNEDDKSEVMVWIKLYLDEEGINYFDDELYCVEAFAAENNLVSNESDMLAAIKSTLEEVGGTGYSDDDRCANAEFVSAYMDSMVRDNQIHPLQYSTYDVNVSI